MPRFRPGLEISREKTPNGSESEAEESLPAMLILIPTAGSLWAELRTAIRGSILFGSCRFFLQLPGYVKDFPGSFFVRKQV